MTPPDDISIWKTLANWLWVGILPLLKLVWSKQDERILKMELAIDKKADSDELNRQRENISNLFKENTSIRAEMASGHSEIKDMIHHMHVDLLSRINHANKQ